MTISRSIHVAAALPGLRDMTKTIVLGKGSHIAEGEIDREGEYAAKIQQLFSFPSLEVKPSWEKF